MQLLQSFLQYALHIDAYLFSFVSHYGFWTYAVLFAIIFCETGLVITPFLPGDSLLFAAGSIAGGSATHAAPALSIELLLVLLIIASILGNKLNYLIGRAIGPRIFATKPSRFLNQKHLANAHAFYEKHGGKTIILARFIPLIRTFAPFVAGISQMNLRLFTFYNITSALLWVGSLTYAGYFLGSIPVVKNNFSLFIYGIIALSLMPPVIVFLRGKLTTLFERERPVTPKSHD